MLELDRVSVTLGPTGREHAILSEVSLCLAEGESLGLVGESGSGKSMTLRTILRTLPQAARVEGQVRHRGNDVLGYDEARLRSFRAGDVSMISQNPQAALNPVLQVRTFLVEGVLAARPGTDAAQARDLAREMLRSVGIAEVDRCLRSYPHQLSGGMLQRVVIAGAVARGAGLLLADEPTTALDVTTQSEVMAILEEARTEAKMAMLFVTHDLDLAAAACDRVAVMSRGRIVETGPAEQVLADPQHEYTQMLVRSKPSLDRKVTTPPGARAAAHADRGEGTPR
jgi:ABC-type dipeptide/oligopeptide/nickel transport system ATPase component